jgi:hypothetical protein
MRLKLSRTVFEFGRDHAISPQFVRTAGVRAAEFEVSRCVGLRTFPSAVDAPN